MEGSVPNYILNLPGLSERAPELVLLAAHLELEFPPPGHPGY